jgi:SAM-dependent methyltransferase
MHAGPWCEGYVEPEQWRASFDAVVTCYFLDTLSDPAAAVRHVRRLLRPGGVWINVGPLHWHDAPARLRFSFDELLALLRLGGFEILLTRRLGAVPYLSIEPPPRGFAERTRRRLRSAWPRAWAWWRREGHASASAAVEEERHDVVFWVAKAPP